MGSVSHKPDDELSERKSVRERVLVWMRDRPVFSLWLLMSVVLHIQGIATLNASFIDLVMYAEKPELLRAFVMTITTVYPAIIAMSPVLWLMYYYPIRRRNFFSRLIMHQSLSVAVGVVSIFLMVVGRLLLLGNDYDYGGVVNRFMYEYSKIFIPYWVTYAVVQFIRMYLKWENDRLQRARLEKELTRARMLALQRQLNPHFLFNTLNMVSSAMRKNIDDADNMLTYLSDMLRYTLNERNTDIIPLNAEFDYLDMYVNIMKARFRERLQVTCILPKEAENIEIPGFILQPLVENAIQYSMDKADITRIEVKSEIRETSLEITVSDNGPGIDSHVDPFDGGGIGLKNVRDLLGNAYGGRYSFSLDNQPSGGLLVRIVVPLTPGP